MGDWERLEMRFEDGMPTDLYLNAHSFGAFYTYGPGIFTFVRGKSYVLNNQANIILYFAKHTGLG